MIIEKQAAKKSKTHTIYKNAAGKRVPGVTTITGVMDKPALIKWANNLGLQGIDSTKYVDELATIGTLAHYLVECHLRKEKPDLLDYSKNQIDLAENGLLKFMEWENQTGYEPILIEAKLVSEKYQYGGQIDTYGILKNRNDIKILCDLKTCKAIYGDHFTQTAGYNIALKENGHQVDEVHIIRIGRNEDEGFEDKICPAIDLHEKRFILCRELYEINKQIKK